LTNDVLTASVSNPAWAPQIERQLPGALNSPLNRFFRILQTGRSMAGIGQAFDEIHRQEWLQNVPDHLDCERRRPCATAMVFGLLVGRLTGLKPYRL
jgi:hypothetical protein